MWRTLALRRTVNTLRRANVRGFGEAAALERADGNVEITPRCVQRLQKLREQRKTNVVLRVTVDGGGCSGFQYTFDLENWDRIPTVDTLTKQDDVLFQKDDAHVIVDRISLSFMSGAKIDYMEELISSSFRIMDNPNAEGSCGCGTSFSPKQ